MSRLARLEARIADLESVLANLRFTSDAPTTTVMVPVPTLDSSGNPTGAIETGYLQIKTGPTSGEIKLTRKSATLTVR